MLGEKREALDILRMIKNGMTMKMRLRISHLVERLTGRVMNDPFSQSGDHLCDSGGKVRSTERLLTST